MVSSVRDSASRKIYAILNVLYDNEMYRECVINNILAFS